MLLIDCRTVASPLASVNSPVPPVYVTSTVAVPVPTPLVVPEPELVPEQHPLGKGFREHPVLDAEGRRMAKVDDRTGLHGKGAEGRIAFYRYRPE